SRSGPVTNRRDSTQGLGGCVFIGRGPPPSKRRARRGSRRPPPTAAGAPPSPAKGFGLRHDGARRCHRPLGLASRPRRCPRRSSSRDLGPSGTRSRAGPHRRNRPHDRAALSGGHHSRGRLRGGAMVLGGARAHRDAAGATQAAVSRLKKPIPGRYEIAAMAIGVSTALTLAWVIAVVVRVHPWYEPQYVIPIAGMILGNAM